MAALQDLAKWSADLPDWLSDAARRCIQKGQLDAQDFDDLAAILMKSADIPDPLGRNALRLDPATIPAEPPPGASISLKATVCFPLVMSDAQALPRLAVLLLQSLREYPPARSHPSERR